MLLVSTVIVTFASYLREASEAQKGRLKRLASLLSLRKVQPDGLVNDGWRQP